MNLTAVLDEPALHLRIRAGWRLGRSEDGAALAATATDGRVIPLADYAVAYDGANARLAAGAPLLELRDLVRAGGGEGRAADYLAQLQRLCRWGLIHFPLRDREIEQAVIEPQWPAWIPTLAPEAPAPGRRLHRFACLRRVRDSWLLESPRCGARLAVADPAALEAPLVRRVLAAAGFLEPEPSDDRGRRDALAQWEFHDLLFHVHQRLGWRHDPWGAHFPFLGDIAPLPAKRPAWPGNPIGLPRAPDAAGRESFAALLERRRSHRVYDEAQPLSLAELGALLDRAARIRSFHAAPVGASAGLPVRFEMTRRPYPSAGATHALEIYPVVARCDGLGSGLYHYDAAAHALTAIPAPPAAVAAFVRSAKRAAGDQAEPQVVLAIAARFGRMLWKYRAIGYGNLLRDTGGLYQTLYLAATELGLSPCGLGAGNSELFARLTGLDPLIEGTVGDFLVGGRPARPDPPTNS